MLDEKDLQALQVMMKAIVDERAMQTEKTVNERTEKLIDASANETRTTLTEEMDKRFTQSENLILEELDRTRSIVEDKIAAVQKNMDELAQHYRITKLESDNTSLLLQMIAKLDKEVEELKQRIA